MKKFLPAPRLLAEVVRYLQHFVPRLEEELVRLEKKIPEKVPTEREILTAVRDDPEIKDAIYRYIKKREERENA